VSAVSTFPLVSSDAVDAILEQWRRERPDLDPGPMGVFGRISRIHALVQESIESVFRRHGLTGADFDVLATLRRAGAPYRLTPTALGRSMMVSSGGTTKRLDRLEGRGLVRRSRDPADRRGTLVSLTAKGRAAVDLLVAEHVHNEQRLLETLTAEQRRQLAELLRVLLLAIDEA
jgi:DNA-binding MarR family transcriptional regulator